MPCFLWNLFHALFSLKFIIIIPSKNTSMSDIAKKEWIKILTSTTSEDRSYKRGTNRKEISPADNYEKSNITIFFLLLITVVYWNNLLINIILSIYLFMLSNHQLSVSTQGFLVKTSYSLLIIRTVLLLCFSLSSHSYFSVFFLFFASCFSVTMVDELGLLDFWARMYGIRVRIALPGNGYHQVEVQGT